MILVIGGTGRLGKLIVEKLLEKNYSVACFVRESSDASFLKSRGVEIRYGDLNDYKSLLNGLKGIDVVIHTPNISGKYYSGLIDACKRSQIARGIFIGTTSIFTSLKTELKQIKLSGEKMITESGINYTIIRPTMIYGIENDGNMSKLIKVIKKYSVIPVFGSGSFLQQPVTYHDLADAVVLCMEHPISINNAYNIAGKNAVTYNEVIDQTAKAMGRKILKVHIPYKFSRWLVSISNKILKKPPFSVEQIDRLNEHKNFSIEKAQVELGYDPVQFEIGISKEISFMKSKGII